jgi:hypothetical protein
MNKKIYAFSVMLFTAFSFAQTTNTFPATGKVGIGTTTPSASLEIKAPASTTSALTNFLSFKDNLGIERFRYSASNSTNGGGVEGALRLFDKTGTENFFLGRSAFGADFMNLSSGYHFSIGQVSSIFNVANVGMYINDTSRFLKDIFIDSRIIITGTPPVASPNTPGIFPIPVFPTTAGSINVSGYKLFVKGGILTEEIRVALASTWADYVFKKDYKLPSLQAVEKHIQEKGHLINVPSADEVAASGINLGEMSKIQQEKIEELTLYIIEQNKINEKQAQILKKQNQEIEALKALVKTIVRKNN